MSVTTAAMSNLPLQTINEKRNYFRTNQLTTNFSHAQSFRDYDKKPLLSSMSPHNHAKSTRNMPMLLRDVTSRVPMRKKKRKTPTRNKAPNQYEANK